MRFASGRPHSIDGAPGTELRLRTVGEQERRELLAHYLRLSADDRRLRFLRVVPDEGLRAHVAALDLNCGVRLALFDSAGSLVALAEGFCYACGARHEMEVAFSTDAPWRRLGLAKSLGSVMAAHARASGAQRMVLHCDARNAAMRSLLSSVGATSEIEEAEINAVWSVAASSTSTSDRSVRPSAAPVCR